VLLYDTASSANKAVAAVVTPSIGALLVDSAIV
jgi:hypothetical protein